MPCPLPILLFLLGFRFGFYRRPAWWLFPTESGLPEQCSNTFDKQWRDNNMKNGLHTGTVVVVILLVITMLVGYAQASVVTDSTSVAGMRIDPGYLTGSSIRGWTEG